MDAIKKAFLRVREDMDKIRYEIEQIRDIQGIILDKIGIEAAEIEAEEIEVELNNKYSQEVSKDNLEDNKEDDEDIFDDNLEDDKEENEDIEEDDDDALDEEDEDDDLDEDLDEDEDEEEDDEEVKTKSKDIQGKFIATKTGKRYHIQSCNLVKNIAEKNKLIFNSAEEADEEGLLMCHCVKKQI